jgi:hypothetical protein
LLETFAWLTQSHNENPVLNIHHLSLLIIGRLNIISVSQVRRVTFPLWLGMFVFATRLAVDLTPAFCLMDSGSSFFEGERARRCS